MEQMYDVTISFMILHQNAVDVNFTVPIGPNLKYFCMEKYYDPGHYILALGQT